MIGGSGLRWAGVLAVVLLVAAGCGSGESERTGSEPVAKPGVVTNPRRPLIVQPLPDGWSVQSVRFSDFADLSADWGAQTLYLPPGSTPEHGPALAIGSHPFEQGLTLCGQGRPVPEASKAFYSGGRLVRTGSLLEVEGQVDTEASGYVIGRDVTEEQIVAASRVAQFPVGGRPVVPDDGLPSGFRQVAIAPVLPNAVLGEMISLVNAGTNEFVNVGAYEGDVAADLVTQFWTATLATKTCAASSGPWAKKQLRVGETDVFIEGAVSQAVVDRIAANLVETDDDGLEAFRTKVDDLPASAVVAGCFSEPGTGVLVDGTDEEVRWVLGISLDTDSPTNCSGFVIDGQVQSGVSGSSAPIPAGDGSFGIEVRANSFMSGHVSETLQLVGGTVPAAAKRVEITGAGGATTDATLKDGGTDPTRQFFGGLLFVPIGDLAPPTVIAYDADNQVVGRYVPPV